MNNKYPIYSKALKKNLARKHQDSMEKSLEVRNIESEPLKEWLTGKPSSSYIVSAFEQDVFFPTNLREALKGRYSAITILFKEGIEIHNKFIAGNRFPDDGFEWFNQPEISEFQSRLYDAFANLGKQLAHKKRRKSVFEALDFLQKNVSSPLDKFTWIEGCRLDFLFEKSFDLLVQSYLSEFLYERVLIPIEFKFEDPLTMNFNEFCNAPSEANFLKRCVGLYNIRDYLVVEHLIKNIVTNLCITENGSSINNELKLFDIYELIPLYIKSWSVDKQKIVINDQLAIFLYLDYGFPSFVVGKPSDKADVLISSTFQFYWSVTNQFMCFAKLDSQLKEMQILGDYVLNKFHHKLVSLFAIRKPEIIQTIVTPEIGDKTDEVADFTFKYHQTLIETEKNSSSVFLQNDSQRHNVPSMSMSSFFTFMQNKFACNVDGGKGSEMKIWRNGTKIYTLGRHKREQKISSFLIKKILKRLDIEPTDWLNRLKSN